MLAIEGNAHTTIDGVDNASKNTPRVMPVEVTDSWYRAMRTDNLRLQTTTYLLRLLHLVTRTRKFLRLELVKTQMGCRSALRKLLAKTLPKAAERNRGVRNSKLRSSMILVYADTGEHVRVKERAPIMEMNEE